MSQLLKIPGKIAKSLGYAYDHAMLDKLYVIIALLILGLGLYQIRGNPKSAVQLADSAAHSPRQLGEYPTVTAHHDRAVPLTRKS